MNNDQSQPYVPPFVRELMKDASEEEILEAVENLRRCIKVLYAISERERVETVCSVCGRPKTDSTMSPEM